MPPIPGTDAALKLIKLAASDPNASAVTQFAQAASANKSVFLHADGTPRRCAKSMTGLCASRRHRYGSYSAVGRGRRATVFAAGAMIKVVNAQDARYRCCWRV